MTFDPLSFGAAPLVAKAIGRSLGVEVVVDPYASTAYVYRDPNSGGYKMVFPSLPVDVDEQLMTILWGMTHHEGGHIRHTDFEVFEQEPELRTDRCLLGLLQALEDIRMERAHIRLYPGASRILSNLVRVLVDIGFFKPLPSDSDVSVAFHAFVLKHLRTTVLGQQALADQALGARRVLEDSLGSGFVTRLVAELQPILVASTTTDALNLAYRIRDFLKDELEQQQQPPPSGTPPDDIDQSNNDSVTQSEGDPDNSQQGDSPCPESSDSDLGDQDNMSDLIDDKSAQTSPTEDDTDHSSQTDALKGILDGSDLDQSLGDLGDGLSNVLEESIKDQASRPIALPQDDLRRDGNRDSSAITKARSISSRLAVQLKRQLESHNDVVADPATRGKRISRRHLHRVAFKDYRIFSKREYLPEVNTAVVSLIDVSSSMRGQKIDIANQAILSTSLALGTIPFLSHAVGAFPSMKGSDKVELVKDFHEKVELVSSRYSLPSRGMTPMAEALLWAADRLSVRSEDRRIIFVATDGSPDDVDSTKRILTHLHRIGIEVHGLGIQTDDPHDLFDSFATVSNLANLPNAFLTLFQRVLRRSA